MHLENALEKYLAVRNPGGKNDTKRLHLQAIRRFSETLGRTPSICDLTDENLGRHAQKRLSDGKARDTVAGEQAKLLAQWRFYSRRGLALNWPDSKPISKVRRVPKAWTQIEFQRLYSACDIAAPVDKTPGFVWWRCLLSCLFFSGERIGAMLQLQWDGVDLPEGP